MQIPSYSLLTPTSDYSISAERKAQVAEKTKKSLEGTVYERAEVTLNPDSYAYAKAYLTIDDTEIGYFNPLNFKESVEQQMQDKINTPNLHFLKEKQNHSFGGYGTDAYGFMGEEFLKVANLPSDYKIHKNALQAIYDVSTIPVLRDNEVHAIFESIDLIAGISYAYNELQNLTNGTFDSKEAYSGEEILEFLGERLGGFVQYFGGNLNTPLMQDYTNEKGEFKREGILLMYSFFEDTFTKAESPFTQLTEYGKFTRGMPSSYSPKEEDLIKKQKTPEELRKEMLDKLGEVYLKILENAKGVENKDSLESVNGFINAMIKDKSFYGPRPDNVLIVEIEK
ncbi:hypothetical protein LS70_009730 [Helicobacter sp. MIT 11-5569]|uniref:hypothetical protein n=1 Tax=Helicobacter sp. MIT 11-5569 TaxID=1548151 RepID=UPI00051FDFB9|nr:hypothetical protein [Helicobacter sp. MIT 11-5569]TLD79712.1 hypothetical protein LS70_009730 [Helicobacter sp. MIT 11-5569]